MDRGERRYRTQKHARRQYELRIRIVYGGDVALLQGHDQHPHSFSKRAAMYCRCSGRRHGNPRVAGGLCDIGKRDWVYELRNRTRDLDVLARNGETDWDSDEIEALVAIPKKS